MRPGKFNPMFQAGDMEIQGRGVYKTVAARIKQIKTKAYLPLGLKRNKECRVCIRWTGGCGNS